MQLKFGCVKHPILHMLRVHLALSSELAFQQEGRKEGRHTCGSISHFFSSSGLFLRKHKKAQISAIKTFSAAVVFHYDSCS